MSGQDASSDRRHHFFTHDSALDDDLDGWHDAPEPSWLSEDEPGDGDDSLDTTSNIPAYDLGPSTESFVVDLTGPQAMVGAPLEPAPGPDVDSGEGATEPAVSRHAAPMPAPEAPAPPRQRRP